MKILRWFFGVIAAIFILLFGVVFLCYLNPNLAPKISQVISSVTGTNKAVSKQSNPTSITVNTADTSSGSTAAGNTSATDTTNVNANSSNTTSDTQSNSTSNTYIPPSTTTQQIASEVQGKSGYVPVTGTVSQSADANAASQSTGLTGDGLNFDTSMYPYYGMLSDTQKKLYAQIYANAKNLTQTFSPVVTVNQSDLNTAFVAVSNDHPELFWLDSGYQAKATMDGTVAEITLQWNDTANQITQSKQAFSKAANAILQGVPQSASAYEKEVYVHDKLLAAASYDLQAPLNQSAYSALVNGKTVCAGYAKAFAYLMQQLQIPCYYCTGVSGENHAWNIIKLEDGYYNVDTTWDDTTPATQNYLNKTDAEFAKDHTRTDLSVNLPACNGITYDKPNDSSLPKLSDYGFKETDVLTNLTDYNANCQTQLMSQTLNSITFQNVVKDEALWNQVYASYQDNTYENAYMKQVLQQKNATQAQIGVKATALQGGYYLVEHTVSNIQ